MPKLINYIKLKDKEIPLIIRSYKNSKSIKLYFKENILYISKPKYVNNKEIMKILEEDKEDIYNNYIKLLNLPKSSNGKKWETGEKILYKGEEFNIIREKNSFNKISIKINEDFKNFVISIPESLIDEEIIKQNVDRGIKQIFKNNTIVYLNNRLPFFSQKMNIQYNSFKVQDAISRFGSCVPSKKALHFSSRIIMLKEEMIDAIIVHELCHIIYPNHSKDFYNLIKEYIPDYDIKDRWLKENSGKILF